MEKFITVATFHYPHEITILKHRLAMEGIAHFFENEEMINLASMYSLALGGIRLKIHPEDRETVELILRQLDGDRSLKIV